MARYPAPGRVKTRLARALGAELACRLYGAFVLDLADRLRRLPYRVTWAYEPAEAPFADLVPGDRSRPQEGRDLGERMACAVAAEFRDGPGPVLVIGADVPHVSAAALSEAVTALRRDADVVLGPAADGGYYLIGVTAPAPPLFDGLPWGTSRVLDATLARARSVGLRSSLLAPGFDVDVEEDLDRLAALLARKEVELPRTAAILEARSGRGVPPAAKRPA
jgi:uncharacterized protein